MKRLILATLALAITTLGIPQGTKAITSSDQSCMKSTGVWDGNLCPADANHDGTIQDCSEMQICYRPSSGACTRGSSPTDLVCIYPDGTKQSCTLMGCQFTLPACGLQGGIESPVFQYTCSSNNLPYNNIEDCQAICGANCACPPPGIYNDTIPACDSEPVYQCASPYQYDTSFYQCLVDRKCPDSTAWDDNYGKCIGDPIWQCPDSTYTFQEIPLARCEKKPPDCPASTSTPPLWEPTFLTDGKCTTTQEDHCAGEPAYS